MPTEKPAREKPLTPKRYAALLKDVGALIEDADGAAAVDKINAYYQVGERIQKEEITHKAGYHHSILRDIAADTHIAQRILQRAVVFVESYPKGVPLCEGLNWTHMRTLLTVSDPKAREEFRRLVIKEGLSSRELAALLASPPKSEEQASPRLPRPTEYEYLYRAKVTGIIDGDTIDVEIDLGFQTKREQRIRLAGINTPPVDTEKGREAKRFLSASLLKCGTLVLKTVRVDLHGCYVAHIFTAPQTVSLHQCFTQGAYLNAQLLKAGVARLSR